jgi:cation diffusion facilitator CzcD-associated flavoprotein CzcO
MQQPLSAVIVGAGFSGICAGIELRRAGIHDFVILEKASRIGGTWRENTYPGAACDVPSHLYSYSFEPNPRWSHTYGGQAEILAYLEHCVAKYRLAAYLRMDRHVGRAVFDERSGTWRVEANGETFVARSLVLGNGSLHVPQLPAIAGRDSFAGASFHSARWDHGYELAGKRVAVIGTGASAIQFVPAIAPRVAELHVFQRTPPWIIPKHDRAITRAEQWLFDRVPPAHWLRRTGLYWSLESRVVGFAFAPKINELIERFVLRDLVHHVPEPELRAKLTPDYRLGCKRVLISSDYYATMRRANVELITDHIEAVTPHGVRTADGRERAVDAIIYGTGFHVTDYLSAIEIVGRGGVALNDAWRTSPRNYLGINVAGFPNLFLLMGPNTGLGHNSMIFMIEAQARYARTAIETLRDRGLAYLDVRPDVERAFRDELARKMKHTVWTTGCRSWYQTPEGEVFLWPGATFDYWWRTRRLALGNYVQRAA